MTRTSRLLLIAVVLFVALLLVSFREPASAPSPWPERVAEYEAEHQVDWGGMVVGADVLDHELWLTTSLYADDPSRSIAARICDSYAPISAVWPDITSVHVKGDGFQIAACK